MTQSQFQQSGIKLNEMDKSFMSPSRPQKSKFERDDRRPEEIFVLDQTNSEDEEYSETESESEVEQKKSEMRDTFGYKNRLPKGADPQDIQSEDLVGIQETRQNFVQKYHDYRTGITPLETPGSNMTSRGKERLAN